MELITLNIDSSNDDFIISKYAHKWLDVLNNSKFNNNIPYSNNFNSTGKT